MIPKCITVEMILAYHIIRLYKAIKDAEEDGRGPAPYVTRMRERVAKLTEYRQERMARDAIEQNPHLAQMWRAYKENVL